MDQRQRKIFKWGDSFITHTHTHSQTPGNLEPRSFRYSRNAENTYETRSVLSGNWEFFAITGSPKRKTVYCRIVSG